MLPWDAIIALVNKALDIYIEETNPVTIYKRRLNSKYQEWKNFQTKLEVVRSELKKAVINDLDEDVIILTHQRAELIRRMDAVNKELETLWSMKNIIVPKDIIIEK